ncbi:hypothetical protein V6O07_12855, partial [Arthrospira platensis SPKY2]
MGDDNECHSMKGACVMVYDKEYVDDLLVRLAHNSSAIEGNTISLPETADIILNGKMPSSNKDVREFYEIDNHKY